MRPPKYYDKLQAIKDPFLFDDIKEQRETLSYERQDNNTPERLKAREKCHKLRAQKLRRPLEENQ